MGPAKARAKLLLFHILRKFLSHFFALRVHFFHFGVLFLFLLHFGWMAVCQIHETEMRSNLLSSPLHVGLSECVFPCLCFVCRFLTRFEVGNKIGMFNDFSLSDFTVNFC